MSDRSVPKPEPVNRPAYKITPQKPPTGCLWVGGIIVGVPAFIVWVKAVAVLVNWLLGG